MRVQGGFRIRSFSCHCLNPCTGGSRVCTPGLCGMGSICTSNCICVFTVAWPCHTSLLHNQPACFHLFSPQLSMSHSHAEHFAPGVVHVGNKTALCHTLAHALRAGSAPALSTVRASGARHAPGADRSTALAPAPAPMETWVMVGAAQPAKQPAGRLMPFSVLKACQIAYLKQVMQHMQCNVLNAGYAANAT